MANSTATVIGYDRQNALMLGFKDYPDKDTFCTLGILNPVGIYCVGTYYGSQ